MKRFDATIEISKQLIAVASAAIFGVGAFTGSLFQNENAIWVFIFIFLVMALFVVSLCFGVLALGGAVNLIEMTEKRQAACSSIVAKSARLEKPKFVSVFDSKWSVRFNIIQQISFALGFICLFLGLFVDRTIGASDVSTLSVFELRMGKFYVSF